MKTPVYINMLAALATCGLGQAQTPAEKASPAPIAPTIDFSTLDKDADGKLSKEEALTVVELDASFDRLDTDRDGSVSPTEFSRWSRAGKATALPHDPTTAPTGSAGAQHMPNPN
jgi:hypothetical protein